MRKADIAFIATMLTIQLPLLASLWVLAGYIAVGKIYKKIKDYYLTLTIPIV
tara:strand:- start:559 stop:714 length:156 start_codon:yes stop_codon:yes gene_type:complete